MVFHETRARLAGDWCVYLFVAVHCKSHTQSIYLKRKKKKKIKAVSISSVASFSVNVLNGFFIAIVFYQLSTPLRCCTFFTALNDTYQ